MSRDTGEPFEIIDMLGRGGFACTYRARVIDPELKGKFGDFVAIKVPHGRREARVLQDELELNAGLHMRMRKISSANLVRYLGFELFEGRIVMVMEFVPQGSLRKRMNRRLPAAEAAQITQGVLRGLALIHAEEIVHRDIKPENILMAGLMPKIADFGIARIIDAGQLAVTQAGTLPYMSPEILSAAGASYPSDLWSTGITLYEMLTGSRPFGTSPMPQRQLIDEICDKAPVPVRDLCPDVPHYVSEVIARALRKDPRDRFASADEMCRALEPPGTTKNLALERELEALLPALDDPGRADATEAQLGKLIERFPSDFRCYQYLAQLLTRRQRNSDAARLLRTAVQLAPGDGPLHWRLALALEPTGDKAAAKSALARAIEIGLPANLREHAARLMAALDKGRQ